MRILRATLDHLPDARLLLQEYYDAIAVVKRDAPDELRAFLTDPRSGFWIADEKATPAGCVVIRPLPGVPLASECKRLYVRPEFRGRGVAGALLDAMEAFAARAGYTAIYLDSKDDLVAALRLYEQRGYSACARYNDNPQATVFLRKLLDCSG